MSEKAKLIRGDPPKIDFKKKGEPPKNEELMVTVMVQSYTYTQSNDKAEG